MDDGKYVISKSVVSTHVSVWSESIPTVSQMTPRDLFIYLTESMKFKSEDIQELESKFFCLQLLVLSPSYKGKGRYLISQK